MNQLTTRSRLFLWLSLFLALSDGVFVWINYRAERNELKRQIDEQAQDLRHTFETLLHAEGTRMQQVAAYIAGQPLVRQLFLAGRQGAEAEGGGSGGLHAERNRQALLGVIAPSWQRQRDDYDTRQLHFQYGEHATSFLRVHAPERHGDTLEDVRFTIVDAIRERRPTQGFETGRVVSGIRGVVPVDAYEPESGDQAFVGVLEAGTSFRSLLNALERSRKARFAVLLRKGHVENIYFTKALEAYRGRSPVVGDYYVEATLHPDETLRLGTTPWVESLLGNLATGWDRHEGRPLGMTVFPLRDYRGGKDPAQAPVGAVLAWFDFGDAIAQADANLRTNLMFALGGFLAAETLLFFGLRTATRRLERTIDEQTHALQEKANRDELTGLFNRRHLHEAMATMLAHMRRSREPISLAMMDLDHFKRINDRHGHLKGDDVLREVSGLIRNRLRESDLAFRYGGEELLLVLMGAPAEAARNVCEEICANIERSAIAGLPVGAVTASFGVCPVEEDFGEAIGHADAALYAAKRGGRNRVEMFATADEWAAP